MLLRTGDRAQKTTVWQKIDPLALRRSTLRTTIPLIQTLACTGLAWTAPNWAKLDVLHSGHLGCPSHLPGGIVRRAWGCSDACTRLKLARGPPRSLLWTACPSSLTQAPFYSAASCPLLCQRPKRSLPASLRRRQPPTHPRRLAIGRPSAFP